MAIQSNAPGFYGSVGAVNLRDVALGDELAIAALWDHYYPRLVRFFAVWYRRRPRPVVDEEDLALDVIDRLCRRLKSGNLPDALSQKAFERVVLVAARRRLLSQRRFDRRAKRNGDRSQPLDEGRELPLPRVPEFVFVVDLRSDLKRLIEGLPSDSLRTLVEQRLEGNEVGQIARFASCSPCTVRRHLRFVQSKWTRELGRP